MATSGIWNHALPANTLTANSIAHPAANSSSANSGDVGSNISANDFLTLLVTEMQNQDPTANTDPNEYINQLVQVNSLEQLISINQTLSTDLGSSGASSSGGVQPSQGANQGGASLNATASHSSLPATSTSDSAIGQSVATMAGNLGAPHANSAAQRVAQGLASTGPNN